MNENDRLAEHFEEHRPRLRGVAYRMLGSLTEAEDAVQDTWLRFSRARTSEVENLGGWLTTIVARVCLNILRSRNTRLEDPVGAYVPDPIVSSDGPLSPDDEALLADSVSLALLVVLDTLAPPERLVFVLHDMFGLPFEEIAPMVDRSPAAARQLASQARRRVKGAEIRTPDADLARQREVVDAFFAAARGGGLRRPRRRARPGRRFAGGGRRQGPSSRLRGPRRRGGGQARGHVQTPASRAAPCARQRSSPAS